TFTRLTTLARAVVSSGWRIDGSRFLRLCRAPLCGARSAYAVLCCALPLQGTSSPCLSRTSDSATTQARRSIMLARFFFLLFQLLKVDQTLADVAKALGVSAAAGHIRLCRFVVLLLQPRQFVHQPPFDVG